MCGREPAHWLRLPLYQTVGAAAPVFHPMPAPESSDMQQLVAQIAGRIGRALERRGLVERDLENAWLSADTEAGPLTCTRCGGQLKIIASIEEPQLIAKILSHLGVRSGGAPAMDRSPI